MKARSRISSDEDDRPAAIGQERTACTPGASHLATVSLEHRRRHGQVYTPDHLVAFVLDETGYVKERPIEDASFLDFASGAGAFIIEAVTRLARRYAVLGFDVRTTHRQRFLASVEASIFAVDVDAGACRLTVDAVREAVVRACSGPLPADYFVRNALVADFLVDERVGALPPVRAGGFDFIAGNPPYVSATRLADSYKLRLTKVFETASGRVDLYTVFMERAVALLRSHGRLGVVTPDKFLSSQSAGPLRSFLLRTCAVRTVARFRSHTVFRQAATVPCVSVWEKGATGGACRMLDCGESSKVADRSIVPIGTLAVQGRLGGAPWLLKPRELVSLADHLQGNHPTLQSVVQRLSAGIATGRDGIYVLSEETAAMIEPELLRPAIRGRDIKAFGIAEPKRRLLLPYTFASTGEPQLIDLRAFPRAAAYLERHRAELSSRHCVRVWGKAWYDVHDPVGADMSPMTKLVVPDVATANRFALDAGQFVILHSAYYLVPRPGVDPYLLLGVLNSSLIEFLVRLRAPVVKDRFVRYRRQFLVGLPIPRAAPGLARDIGNASRKGDAVELDRLVATLFDVDDVDLRRVEHFVSTKH